MAWKAVIMDIIPIRELVVGEWDTKDEAEKHMYTELGMHWQRFLEPMKDIDVRLKLQEVI